MNSEMKCMAIILAGGAGTRLGALTAEQSKPAVSFGGSYRIIDYTLNNCSHSGIKRAGVLTQYKPETLHEHLQLRESPELTIDCLQAIETEYKGTADAVYKNLDYIAEQHPTHVLILSGDHVYQMNYQEMFDFHLKQQAEVTVASIQVPLEDANRFGILSVDSNQKVKEFNEKPNIPTSSTASMGIYLFDWHVLKDCLEEDAAMPQSNHDFGKNIIPHLLLRQSKLFAYPFKHYWRDVGTIHSYWQAQMDWVEAYSTETSFESTKQVIPLSLSDSSIIPIHVQAASGKPYLSRSVISPSAYISEGCVIDQSVVLPGATIGKGVYLKRVVIAENTHVPDHFSINSNDEVILVTAETLHKYQEHSSYHQKLHQL